MTALRILGLTALLLGACQSTQSSEGPAELPEAYRDGPVSEAPSQDRSVESFLAQVLRSSEIVDGRRVVALDLCNSSARTLSFAYGVEWLDRAGRSVVDLEGSWTPMVLEAGERRQVELRAPSPAADSWVLQAVAIPEG